jgi:hypothetical protein
MVQDNQRIRNAIRDPSPCRGCTERFTACSGKCPKEARGEYGYDSWKDEIDRVKNERRKYINRTNVRKKYYNEGHDYGEK